MAGQSKLKYLSESRRFTPAAGDVFQVRLGATYAGQRVLAGFGRCRFKASVRDRLYVRHCAPQLRQPSGALSFYESADSFSNHLGLILDAGEILSFLEQLIVYCYCSSQLITPLGSLYQDEKEAG